jgi:hypothetical protein
MFASVTKTILAFFLFLVALALVIRCTSRTASGTQSEEPALSADAVVSVERGRNLVIGGACHDCHSPKIMTPEGPRVDSSRMLSGHPADGPIPDINPKALQPGNWILFSPDLTAFIGPWGLSYSVNLTSDSATGIGAWTEANFVSAIRTGRHMGLPTARRISPPMPWDNYSHMSENDLRSIFAYLKTTPPIHNRVHEPYSPDEVREMMKKEGIRSIE